MYILHIFRIVCAPFHDVLVNCYLRDSAQEGPGKNRHLFIFVGDDFQPVTLLFKYIHLGCMRSLIVEGGGSLNRVNEWIPSDVG